MYESYLVVWHFIRFEKYQEINFHSFYSHNKCSIKDDLVLFCILVVYSDEWMWKVFTKPRRIYIVYVWYFAINNGVSERNRGQGLKTKKMGLFSCSWHHHSLVKKKYKLKPDTNLLQTTNRESIDNNWGVGGQIFLL